MNPWTETAEHFLAAWTSQEVDQVLSVYTDDLVYRDPNTRGDIRDKSAMRHYLQRLFATWNMTWSLREAHVDEHGVGCVLWRASFQRKSGGPTVHADGMDLVTLHNGRVQRNEVQFDRTLLASL